MNEIDRLWLKWQPLLIDKGFEIGSAMDATEWMFRQAMLEALEKQRELSVTKFKEACIELNADEHYHEPLLEMAILTKLEEQGNE